MTRISDKPLAFQALQQRRRERDELLRKSAASRLVRERGYTNVFDPMVLMQQRSGMSCRCNVFL